MVLGCRCTGRREAGHSLGDDAFGAVTAVEEAVSQAEDDFVHLHRSWVHEALFEHVLAVLVGGYAVLEVPV